VVNARSEVLQPEFDGLAYLRAAGCLLDQNVAAPNRSYRASGGATAPRCRVTILRKMAVRSRSRDDFLLKADPLVIG
ncbi:MAG: hypothetical protein VYC71_07000, partial [Planctomycetota bacterium]|nr:hypothetical protein [Planctomycetota bacterium]